LQIIETQALLVKSTVSQFSAGSLMFQAGEYLIDREGKILCGSYEMNKMRENVEIDCRVQSNGCRFWPFEKTQFH
jgi:hypothetical protein